MKHGGFVRTGKTGSAGFHNGMTADNDARASQGFFFKKITYWCGDYPVTGYHGIYPDRAKQF
jgi:hypothetical protein